MPGFEHIQPPGVGRVLAGRYRLVAPIARGGMAEVWEGHDEVLSRPVAVKVLQSHLAADGIFLERFRREAVTAARLAHAGIVATFDTGVDDGTAFIVMELVRGRNLRQWLDSYGRLEPWQAVAVTRQVADALSYAHQGGLVHRDVKPANILLVEDEWGGLRVKVTDFGIAKAGMESGADLTRTGMVLGTPKYLSPEQIRGQDPDPRADLYSLGVVLYEMLVGTAPYVGDTDMATALAHLGDRIPKPSASVRGVPGGLDRVVVDLLCKVPDRRVASAAELRRRLDGLGPLAPPTGGRGGLARGGRRRSGPGPSGPGGMGPSGVGPSAGSATARNGSTDGDRSAGGGSGGGGGGSAGGGSAGGGSAGGGSAGGWDEVPAARQEPGATTALSSAAAGADPDVTIAGLATGGGGPDGGGPSGGSTGGGSTGGGGTGGGGRGGGGRGASGAAGGGTGAALGTRVLLPPPSGPGTDQFDALDAPPPARRHRRSERTAGFVVLALVLIGAIVAAVLLLSGPAHRRAGAASTTVPAGPAVNIDTVSVYLDVTGHQLDNPTETPLTFDGNPATFWSTDLYNSPTFGNLYAGIGLEIQLSRSAPLHTLTVTSTTTGWSASSYVSSAAVPAGQPISAWGSPTTSDKGIDGSTTFSLAGHTGQYVLLWITNLGPSDTAQVAELTVH